MSNEWLQEAEASIDVIKLLSCFTSIPCIVNQTKVDSLYDPTVGVSLMSQTLETQLLCEELLAPTNKMFKLPLGSLVKSCRIA
jgi:hypothetical protein